MTLRQRIMLPFMLIKMGYLKLRVMGYERKMRRICRKENMIIIDESTNMTFQ